jgi:hypothetical protein
VEAFLRRNPTGRLRVLEPNEDSAVSPVPHPGLVLLSSLRARIDEQEPPELGPAQEEQAVAYAATVLPRDSQLFDLVDFDIHLERELPLEWLLTAALGSEATLDAAADVLAEYASCAGKEVGIDWGVDADEEREWLHHLAIELVVSLRAAIRAEIAKTGL